MKFDIKELFVGEKIKCTICNEVIIRGPAFENQIKLAVKNHRKKCHDRPRKTKKDI